MTAAALLLVALVPQAFTAATLIVPIAYVPAVAPVIVMLLVVEVPVSPVGNVQV